MDWPRSFIQFSLELKFNALELDTEVGRLVYLASLTAQGPVVSSGDVVPADDAVWVPGIIVKNLVARLFSFASHFYKPTNLFWLMPLNFLKDPWY